MDTEYVLDQYPRVIGLQLLLELIGTAVVGIFAHGSKNFCQGWFLAGMESRVSQMIITGNDHIQIDHN